MKKKTYKLFSGAYVAKCWMDWCGTNSWTKAMFLFGHLGGIVRWWDGYPQSAGALCFELFDKNGNKLPCESRLKDIKKAIKTLKGA